MKLKIITLLTFAIFLSVNVHAQSEAANNKLKALLIYNFTKYINWPNHYKSGNFVIAVLGRASITPELKKIMGTKKHGSQSIVIEEYPLIDNISKCHILYVPIAKSRDLPAVISALSGKSSLIITEQSGLIENGSCINFIKLPSGKLGFELNTKETELRKLNINNTLTNQLAHRVIQ